jgi:hypothetical protein
VRAWYAANPNKYEAGLYDPERLTYWELRHYDNEEKAREFERIMSRRIQGIADDGLTAEDAIAKMKAAGGKEADAVLLDFMRGAGLRKAADGWVEGAESLMVEVLERAGFKYVAKAWVEARRRKSPSQSDV